MLGEELARLVNMARADDVVASNTLAGGMQLAVYPMEDCVLLVVGYGPELAHHVRMEDVLRKRGRDLARFGPWLPCVFNDGGSYVVRRVAVGGADGDGMAAAEADLAIAEELLT